MHSLQLFGHTSTDALIGSTSLMYVVVSYLPSWLTSVAHLSGAATFLPSGVAGPILTVGSPLSGKLTDRLGRRKPILYVTGVPGVESVNSRLVVRREMSGFDGQ